MIFKFLDGTSKVNEHCMYDTMIVSTNIYILNVAALDETIIPSCLHFSMQNIEHHVVYITPLGGVTSTSTNNFLCLSTIA